MSAIAVIILSSLLGVLSSTVYFYLHYQSMNSERNRLASEVDRLENEFLAEFSKLNIDELQETNAGKELLELLQTHGVFPQKISNEATSSSLKTIVLNLLLAIQPVAQEQNIDFRVDIVDPPQLEGDISPWQKVFNQLISSSVKYSWHRKGSVPNIIEISGRGGETRYFITIENYGTRLKSEILGTQRIILGTFQERPPWTSALLTPYGNNNGDYNWLKIAPIIVKAKLRQLGRNGIDRITLITDEMKREIKRWLMVKGQLRRLTRTKKSKNNIDDLPREQILGGERRNEAYIRGIKSLISMNLDADIFTDAMDELKEKYYGKSQPSDEVMCEVDKIVTDVKI